VRVSLDFGQQYGISKAYEINLQVKILVEDGGAIETTGVGELCIRSPSLFREYWKLPEASISNGSDAFSFCKNILFWASLSSNDTRMLVTVVYLTLMQLLPYIKPQTSMGK